MAVAFDARTFCALQNPTADVSFTHTPVGIPKAVLFFGCNYNNASTDPLAGGSVTYGGVPLAHAFLASPLQCVMGGENDGWLYTMAVTSNTATIPTGPQTVVVDTTNALGQFRGVVITLTATNDAQIETYAALADQSGADPSLTLSGVTRDSWVAGHCLSGQDNLAGITQGSGMTERGEVDFGLEIWEVLSRTVNPTTATTLDWIATADDWSAVGIAISDATNRPHPTSATNADAFAFGADAVFQFTGTSSHTAIKPHSGHAANADAFAFGADAVFQLFGIASHTVVAPHAGAPAGTGAAHDATITGTTGSIVAAGTGTSTDASAGVGASADSPAGTGDAYASVMSIAVRGAELASGTGAAHGTASAPSPSAALGTGAAYFDAEVGSISDEITATIAIPGDGHAWDATVDINESQQGNVVTSGNLVLVGV